MHYYYLILFNQKKLYNIGYKQGRQWLSSLPPLIESVSDSTLDLNNTTILDYNNDSNGDLNSTHFDDRDDTDDSSIIPNSVIKNTNRHTFNPNQTNPFLTQSQNSQNINFKIKKIIIFFLRVINFVHNLVNILLIQHLIFSIVFISYLQSFDLVVSHIILI